MVDTLEIKKRKTLRENALIIFRNSMPFFLPYNYFIHFPHLYVFLIIYIFMFYHYVVFVLKC